MQPSADDEFTQWLLHSFAHDELFAPDADTLPLLDTPAPATLHFFGASIQLDLPQGDVGTTAQQEQRDASSAGASAQQRRGGGRHPQQAAGARTKPAPATPAARSNSLGPVTMDRNARRRARRKHQQQEVRAAPAAACWLACGSMRPLAACPAVFGCPPPGATARAQVSRMERDVQGKRSEVAVLLVRGGSCSARHGLPRRPALAAPTNPAACRWALAPGGPLPCRDWAWHLLPRAMLTVPMAPPLPQCTHTQPHPTPPHATQPQPHAPTPPPGVRRCRGSGSACCRACPRWRTW